MLRLPDKEVSYWVESSGTDKKVYPELKGDITADAVVIGAGIAGLTTAYLLKQSGLKVAVLEKATVGGGVTGYTTGKVTSQHGLRYTRLRKRFGNETAWLYGEANQAAIEQIEEIITKEKIECGWRREANVVFTDKDSEVEAIKTEAKIAADLGLPARFTTKTPLPIPVKGAAVFTNQATFHARKYLQGLARAINGEGNFVFEQTKAQRIKHGSPGVVYTAQGRVVAKAIIIASHVPYPIIARGAYCGLEYPLYSHIIATKVKDIFPGMYISSGTQARSMLPVKSGGDTLLLVGGGSHLPGLGSSEKRYRELAEYAEEYLGFTSIDYRWKAYDYLGYDDMPLIGKLYTWTDNTYVATGFMKWGLTNGTVAGMILSDLIRGKKNSWAPVFSSNRLSPVRAIPSASIKIIKHTLT